jgi:phosphoglucosamine mutase
VVIGKDTRLSGYMLENALTAGFTSDGHGRVPARPGADAGGGHADPSMRADVGVMISASHNPHHDNGIKFFGPDGFKLSDEAEEAIEAIGSRRDAELAGAAADRPREAHRRRARPLHGIRQDDLPRGGLRSTG